MSFKAIVRIRRTNQAGPEWSIAHILKAKIIRPGGNECGAEDRLAGQFGNLSLPVDRANKYSVSRQLEMAARNSRSRERVKMVIISFEDSTDAGDRARQVKALPTMADAFVARFAPGAKYWGGVHVDRNHVHCHLAIANWSPVLGTSLNWGKRDLAYMLSMRWTQRHPELSGMIEAGAWSKRIKTVMAYPRSEACRLLVSRLRPDPASMFAELEMSGEVLRYRTDGGHPGVVFQGRKITLKNLNYELNKVGAPLGFDSNYSPVALGKGDFDDLTQQTRIDQGLGVVDLTLSEFDGLCDLPDPDRICRSPEELESLRRFKLTGRISDPRQATVLKRLCRTALIRRAKGASCPLGKYDDYCSWMYGDAEHITASMKQLAKEVASSLAGIGGLLGSAIMMLLAALTSPEPEVDVEFP